MKPSNIVRTEEFNSLPVMIINEGLHGEILLRIQERLTSACQRHSKIIAFLLVVQFPKGCAGGSDNALLSRWLADFLRQLRPYDPSYVWGREEHPESPGRFHFHIVLLLNGNKTQNVWGHLATAQRCWARTLGLRNADGLISLCRPRSQESFRNSFFELVRNAPDFQLKFNETFRYASYIAKSASKRPLPGIRTFGCSELC